MLIMNICPTMSRTLICSTGPCSAPPPPRGAGESPSLEAPEQAASAPSTTARASAASTLLCRALLAARPKLLLPRCRRAQFTAESQRSLGYASKSVIELFYEAGTLVAAGASRSDLPEPFVWDGRTRQWRAPASAYRAAILRLRESGAPHRDLAAAFERRALESRFALVVYDEVHHLPAPKNAVIPKMLLAPYALGLTATPERPDGGHEFLPELVGPIVYRRSPEELAGTYLAPFELVRIPIELTAEERFEYAQADAVYRDFLQKHRLAVHSPEDWQRFILVASTSHSGGREALLAARRRREIQEGAMRKVATLETLLRRHWDDRCLVFAKSVEEVYSLSRRFLIPGVTYETPARERKEILDRFREGRYRAIIASDVLNEGVDVPDAGVAIILAGSASRREYIQRLGRILRPREGKRATLYELVTAETGEVFAARRRREAFV